MTKKAISECSAAELRSYALEVMNFDEIPPRANGPMIVAKLREAGVTSDFIDLPERDEKSQTRVINPKRASTNPDSEGHVAARIKLHAKSGKGGDRPYYFGHNGVGMTIPRDGTVSVIPIGYYSVLQDAKAKIPMKDRDDLTIIGYREVQQHPHDFLGFLTAEEYDRYLGEKKMAG